jgi:hypothetical protein
MYLLVDAVSGCRNAVRELETKLDLSKGMSVLRARHPVIISVRNRLLRLLTLLRISRENILKRLPGHSFETFEDVELQGTTFEPSPPPCNRNKSGYNHHPPPVGSDKALT